MADPDILPPKLRAPLGALDKGEEQKYLEILLDRARPAQRVADTLTLSGFPVGATTIKDFRRKADAYV